MQWLSWSTWCFVQQVQRGQCCGTNSGFRLVLLAIKTWCLHKTAIVRIYILGESGNKMPLNLLTWKLLSSNHKAERACIPLPILANINTSSVNSALYKCIKIHIGINNQERHHHQLCFFCHFIIFSPSSHILLIQQQNFLY